MKIVNVIRAALTRLGVYAVGEEVSAEDSVAALAALNDLLAQYQMQPLMGVPCDLRLPLSMDDELAIEPPNLLGRVIVTGLALDLAPDYGIEPSPSLSRLYLGAVASVKHSNGRMIVKTSDLTIARGAVYAGD